MRIAHLSDLHVLDLTGVPRSRLLLNKRLTGYVNLRLERGSMHKRHVVEAMVDDIRRQRVDHVVVTGDLTNLSLEPEFELAYAILERLGLPPENLSVVPGNHDVYTHGAQRARRFARYFARHITSDLRPMDESAHPSGPFPFVRLRGDVALIGVSTAVARLPLVSSGHAGERQLRALAEALEHPEVRRRMPVVLMHHPIVNPRRSLGRIARGLAEAQAFRRIFDERQEVLVLHGHLHHRARRLLRSSRGRTVHHLGATSASLIHRDADRVSGYNLYEVDAGGLRGVGARVYDPVARTFVDGAVHEADPRYAGH